MLHETIKSIARRSMTADRVIFGESHKRHPLGFDGFNVDLSVDKALLQLNASAYDSATSLQIECKNLTSLLRESLDVNVSTRVARLYKESKVTEVIKKVIAYIVKAVKYIFVELPKKIFNKIKSLFAKKKKDTGFATKTEESMKKTQEAIKKTADSLKAGMESKMNNSETAKEFESWKKEMLSELDGIGKRMDTASKAEADRVTDEVIKSAKKARAEKDANMKVVSEDGVSGAFDELEKTKKRAGLNIARNHAELEEAMKSLNKTMDGLYEKSNIAMKDAFGGYMKVVNDHNSSFNKKTKEIDDLLDKNTRMLDELLDDMAAEEVESMSVYRDAELKMMAENLLASIESGKTDVSSLHRRNFFNTGTFAAIRLISITSNGGDPKRIDTYVTNVLLRAIDKLPYVNEVVAKYMKDSKNIQLFDNLVNSTVNDRPSAVTGFLYDQMRSFQKLMDALPETHNVKCKLTLFKQAVGDRIDKTMSFEDGGASISLDAISDIPTEDMTETVEMEISSAKLKPMMRSLSTLVSAMSNLEAASKHMQNLTTGEIATRLGIAPNDTGTPESATAINHELGRIMEIVNEVVKVNKNVSLEAMKCIYNVSSAEEAVLNKVIANDDKLVAVTMSQLAHYIAHDTKLMGRVWRIINK